MKDAADYLAYLKALIVLNPQVVQRIYNFEFRISNFEIPKGGRWIEGSLKVGRRGSRCGSFDLYPVCRGAK